MMKRFFVGLTCVTMLSVSGSGYLRAAAAEEVDMLSVATQQPVEIITTASAEMPKSEPTPVPTTEPTVAPTTEPTVAPTTEPTVAPTTEPEVAPTTEPTVAPTTEPTVAPTTEPTVAPTTEPEVVPTTEPTVAPTTGPAEDAAISDLYARVTGTVYAEENREMALGSFAGEVVVYLDRQINEATWRIFFDTDVSRQSAEWVSAYVSASALSPITEAQVAAMLPGMTSVRSAGGNPVPLVHFDYAAPTESDEELNSGLSSEDQTEQTEVGTLPPVPVSVHTSGGSMLDLGDSITLRADLSAYEGLTYACEWQYVPVDMQGNLLGDWRGTGASGTEYTYTLTTENVLTAWRLHVVMTP